MKMKLQIGVHILTITCPQFLKETGIRRAAYLLLQKHTIDVLKYVQNGMGLMQATKIMFTFRLIRTLVLIESQYIFYTMALIIMML